MPFVATARNRGEPWGPPGDPFLFSIRRKAGGWEGSCPFHRGTATAPSCKKLVTVRGNLNAAKRMIKEWLLRAPDYDRKYTHMGWEKPDRPMSDEDLERAVATVRAPIFSTA